MLVLTLVSRFPAHPGACPPTPSRRCTGCRTPEDGRAASANTGPATLAGTSADPARRRSTRDARMKRRASLRTWWSSPSRHRRAARAGCDQYLALVRGSDTCGLRSGPAAVAPGPRRWRPQHCRSRSRPHDPNVTIDGFTGGRRHRVCGCGRASAMLAASASGMGFSLEDMWRESPSGSFGEVLAADEPRQPQARPATHAAGHLEEPLGTSSAPRSRPAWASLAATVEQPSGGREQW